MKKCLPIMAKTAKECILLIGDIDWNKIDLVEIRLDCFIDEEEVEIFYNSWKDVASISHKPVIGTYRTEKQGGFGKASLDEYQRILSRMARELTVEYIDIELTGFVKDDLLKDFLNICRKKKIKTIVSYHDMCSTDEIGEIEKLICRIKSMGCDLPKVAYMANDKKDVEKLIAGAKSAHMKVGELIAISMGKEGVYTRKMGKEFGSVITFIRPVGKGFSQIKDIGQQEL